MQNSKVLLVDDEPANLLALEVMLASLDCQLIRANSGTEALRQLLQHEFAAILLDLHMPTMDGMEVARLIRMRKQSSNIPILFITASDPTEFPIEEAYAVGAVDYLAKPVNQFVLRSKVQFFVELHKKNQQLHAMQQALHAAEMKVTQQRTRTILENAKGYAVIELDCDGRIKGWSAASEAITGWRQDEVLGKDIALLFTPEDIADDRPGAEREGALRTGRVDDRRWHLRKDGARFFADGVTVASYDDQGVPQGLTKLFQDTTERMLGEMERERLFKEAQAANARLVDIFHQAPAFLCTLKGPNHVFEMANERYYRLIDRSPEILGRTVAEVLPEVAGQGFIGLLDNVYRTGETFVGTNLTLTVRQADGSYADRIIDFVYVAMRDADGVITGVLAHGIDSSERARYEAQAREADARYRKLIASMDEGFCLIDVMFDDSGEAFDYRFLEVNPVFSQQTGLGDDTVGKTMKSLVPDLDQVWLDRYGHVARTGEAIRFTEEAKAMGRWFDVYATKLGGPGSTTVALLFSDVTVRRQSENDLRRLASELSEANRRKSEFLAVLAHELRNPLAPIRTGLELIRLGAGNPATVTRVREMMDRQVTHMVHLIDDLLDVARITSGKVELKREVVSLKEVMATAIETSTPLINASEHAFSATLPDEELLLHADPVRISQVIGNLLTNAAKYTPHGGTLAIAAARVSDSVVIAVTDNGVGIPAEALPSVFDMFSQVSRNLGRAQGGLGIGLSIVRQLVELHGGSVSVRSDGAGAGTTFTVTLPLAPQGMGQAAAHDDGTPESGAQLAALKILVADDNIDAANSLAALLELRGHRVTLANDGQAALARAMEVEPDMVFLDIGMPGLTGHEVARAIRLHGSLKEVVLVALTGWGSEEDRLRTQEAGFDYHLTKPAHLASVDKLLQAVAASRSHTRLA